MTRTRLLVLTGALAFSVVFLMRMPASWVVPARGNGYSCTAIEGSVWEGGCSALTVGQVTLGQVNWQLHPARLLRGRLAARVQVNGHTLHADAQVEAGLHGFLAARQLVADLPLDPALVPGLPAGLSGRAHADLSLLQLQRGVITALAGRIEVHDLVDASSGGAALGSYRVEFPATGRADPLGQVRDLDGPLAVQGTLRLTRQPGFDLQGMVAPRPQAPESLVNELRFLGSPDPSGRRPFAVSGSF